MYILFPGGPENRGWVSVADVWGDSLHPVKLDSCKHCAFFVRAQEVSWLQQKRASATSFLTAVEQKPECNCISPAFSVWKFPMTQTLCHPKGPQAAGGATPGGPAAGGLELAGIGIRVPSFKGREVDGQTPYFWNVEAASTELDFEALLCQVVGPQPSWMQRGSLRLLISWVSCWLDWWWFAFIDGSA